MQSCFSSKLVFKDVLIKALQYTVCIYFILRQQVLNQIKFPIEAVVLNHVNFLHTAQPPFTMCLRVKFYPPDPAALKEEITRYELPQWEDSAFCIQYPSHMIKWHLITELA